jgi:L-arabinose isomerase
MQTASVGLLPLYLKLYDDAMPQHRVGVERFLSTIADELRQRGLQVVTAPVCRVREEVEGAVKAFEQAPVDAIVTLHLAYSPSEESAPVLAQTTLPLIVLDTTPDYEFGPQQSPDRIMYNHGIHGVQDLCNLLIRYGKPFQIEVGHWAKSDVLERVAEWVRAARLALTMRRMRVGRIGSPFKGMGDFAVPEVVLRDTLGVTVVPIEPVALSARLGSVSDKDVDAELEADKAAFHFDQVDEDVYRRTARVGLAVRRWIEEERLNAFTVNFMEANRAAGLPTMPFLEASKGMARGIGYAGEGDALTAALIGALASLFPIVSFTEMFCPDWAHNSIFLSHMGEMNVAAMAGRPRLVQQPFDFIDTADPVLAMGRFKAGKAVFANLAPGPQNRFTFILAPVQVLDAPNNDKMAASIHGWMQPGQPIANFLAAYSRLGGTHHAALVYGDADVTNILAGFGQLMGWQVAILR